MGFAGVALGGGIGETRIRAREAKFTNVARYSSAAAALAAVMCASTSLRGACAETVAPSRAADRPIDTRLGVHVSPLGTLRWRALYARLVA